MRDRRDRDPLTETVEEEADISRVSHHAQKLLPHLQLKLRFSQLVVWDPILLHAFDDRRYPMPHSRRVSRSGCRSHASSLEEDEAIAPFAAVVNHIIFSAERGKLSPKHLHRELFDQHAAAGKRQVAIQFFAVDNERAGREEMLLPAAFHRQHRHHFMGRDRSRRGDPRRRTEQSGEAWP